MRIRVANRVVHAARRFGPSPCFLTAVPRIAVRPRPFRMQAGMLQLICLSIMTEHGTVLTCHNMPTEHPGADSLPIIRRCTSQQIRLSWGYYYNKVPTWQSRSDMIPGVPYPSRFHARVCPQGGTGCHGYQGATYGPVNYGPVPASCPNCNTGHYSATPQSSSSNGPPVVRPIQSQPQRQGLLGGFRLASMKEMFD